MGKGAPRSLPLFDPSVEDSSDVTLPLWNIFVLLAKLADDEVPNTTHHPASVLGAVPKLVSPTNKSVSRRKAT